ncbi:hypothetical protein [Halomonas sp. BM-2019]|uniref:hypothetical protein n=1 Tax=Halomonas sp. BM-2019 TaxID=2811227 RepID=UPI001B3C20AF|nr:MAG: hypothetical protein J5F18_11605 [Halomonas sp. BM-2019]
MAERHDDRPQTRPIVPDPDASLSPYRLRPPPPPRVWPLWLLLLALLGAVGGGGYLAWEERQRLEGELARLSGELSNIHARFDTALGEGETLERIESRLTALERRDEAHDGLLAVLEEDLASGLEAMLAATQVSLAALERAGAEGRAALADALEAQGDDLAALVGERRRDRERLAALDDRLSTLEAEAGEGEAETHRDALAERLAALNEDLEGVIADRDDEREREDARAARLAALEAEIGELRRTQLALSARLEALRP